MLCRAFARGQTLTSCATLDSEKPMKQNPKLLIKSYGCQMNEYDSAKIADILAASHGFITTEIPTEADLIILNTCSIRAKAEEKIFSELGRLRPLKKKNPALILAVGGCVAMQEQKNIFRRAPYVDIVFGPQTLHRLPEMYEKALQKEKHIIDTPLHKLKNLITFPSTINRPNRLCINYGRLQ